MATSKQSRKKPAPKTSPLTRSKKAIDNYLARRPHRSFRRTRRRDFHRSLAMPGYVSFTTHVARTFWQNRRNFLLLAVIYAVLTALMVGIGSQASYTTLVQTIHQDSGTVFSGTLGSLAKVGLIFFTSSTGGISQNLSTTQQVYAGIIILLSWLTTVWLLRNSVAGRKVKLRDGLYNAGAPILSTFLLVLVLIVQLLPVALVLLAYAAASLTGFLAFGVTSMLFWIIAALLTLISVYWISSTAIALVVVTLPGMYPFQALKIAGDLVIGRRIRILLRILWLALVVIVSWAIVMVPVILFDNWLNATWPAINWLPLVPVVLLLLSSLTVVWVAGYVYMLYRRIVADDAKPA